MNARLLILAALLLGACGKEPAARPPAPGATAPHLPPGEWAAVRRGDLRKTAAAVGSFRARRTTQIGPQVAGRVLEVLVDAGAKVTEGQELVKLDPVLFEIEAAQRKADLESARVAVAEAELNYGRMKNLWEKPEGQEPSVPKKLFDDASSKLESARARRDQAAAALRGAEEKLKQTVIHAPYDGVVTRRLVDPGEPVSATPVTHLLEVQDVATLELEFSLPQEMLARVGAGTAVEFDAEGVPGVRGAAPVDVVYPAIDESTRSFRCRVIVDNAAGRFRPGMLARVDVVEQTVHDVLVVPKAALEETASGWRVVVEVEGRPVARVVVVGVVSDDGAEIKEGLSEGDRVFVPREK